MLFRVLSVAVFAAVAGIAVSQAQTIAQIGDPAENPPAGFKGDQFVDSRGCVFMRISNGATTGWYPRVNGSHKVVCGYPPTFGPKPVIEMADETPVAPAKPVAVKPAPVVVAAAPAVPKAAPGAPTPTVASRMMPAAAPVVAAPIVVAAQPAPYVAAPPASYQVATSTTIPQGSIGCFRSAPVAEVVTLRNGGTAVVCTRGDGTATGWRSPIYPAGAPVGAALHIPGTTQGATYARVAPAGTALASAAPVTRAPVAVPAGYKLAWDDDRLNPLRGQGTAAGQAAQDQIWTRKVPATLVAEAGGNYVPVPPVYKSQVTKSTMNAAPAPAKGTKLTASTMNSATAPVAAAKPASAAASAKLWVQVGSFGVPANAQGAASRLGALGLPVGKSNMTKGGKSLQIVFAGPFASAAEAQRAVALARQAGFGDAFIR